MPGSSGGIALEGSFTSGILWLKLSCPKLTAAWGFGSISLQAPSSEIPSLRHPSPSQRSSPHAYPLASSRGAMMHTLSLSSNCLLPNPTAPLTHTRQASVRSGLTFSQEKNCIAALGGSAGRRKSAAVSLPQGDLVKATSDVPLFYLRRGLGVEHTNQFLTCPCPCPGLWSRLGLCLLWRKEELFFGPSLLAAPA